MGRRSRKYEIEFTACLLACGPMPWTVEQERHAVFNDGIGEVRMKYQGEVMDWWCDWHSNNVQSPPSKKSQFRFYKKFRTWQKVYLRRTRDE